jgi:hypothetical protein
MRFDSPERQEDSESLTPQLYLACIPARFTIHGAL